MAGEASTASPSTEGSSSASAPAKGSPSLELSKPVGKHDDEVWQKHFGADAVDEHKSKAKKDTDKDKKKPEAKESAEKSKAKSDKAEDKPEPKKPPAAAKADKDKLKPDAKPEPKAAPKPKAEPDKVAADADPDAPANDTGKAKKLYEQAKATEDRGEARRLYKQAMREAFGELPPEFDDTKYAAVRTERAKAHAELDAKAKKNEERINEAARILQPAATVMTKLKDAGLGQLTMPLVERAVHVMQAIRALEDGDFTQLAEVVHRATGKTHDEAMQLFVRGVKVSPASRAARTEAEQARREAQAAREQVETLRRELAAKAEADKVQQTEAEQRQAVEQRRAEYLEEIESELDGHPVLKLPRGKERVLAYLIKTADKTLRAPKYSFEQAADRIVAHEKRRLQQVKFLETGEEPAAEDKPVTTIRGRTVPRGETRSGGVVDETPEARFDRIYQKHQAQQRRAR